MRKKIISILLSAILAISLSVSIAVSTQAASLTDTFTFSVDVGGNLEPFTYDCNFDSGKGILRAKYNTLFFKEIGVQVFHTTNSHYGVVACGSKTNSTNTAAAGAWTSRADVTTGSSSSRGTVTAFY
ncbi:MAG: hypothetical protein K1V97_04480 [Lachnospiraceae bacterium]